MPNRTAAKFIIAQRHSLAQAVVARQYDRQPELRQRYGDGGMSKCVQDTDYSLAYLAAALNYSSPAIFKSYIVWAKNVLEVRNVRTEDMEDNLQTMWGVLQEQLPEGSATSAQPYLEDAFRTPPQGGAEFPTLLAGDDPLTALARQYLRALLRTDRHEAIAFFRMAIDIARHHHERFDGNGYPDRLAGEEIPLSARIVAIADVYDALRSKRIYKPALPHADAVRIMVKEDAGHFDPFLLAAFQRCCEDFERIFQQLTD